MNEFVYLILKVVNLNIGITFMPKYFDFEVPSNFIFHFSRTMETLVHEIV